MERERKRKGDSPAQWVQYSSECAQNLEVTTLVSEGERDLEKEDWRPRSATLGDHGSKQLEKSMRERIGGPDQERRGLFVCYTNRGGGRVSWQGKKEKPSAHEQNISGRSCRRNGVKGRGGKWRRRTAAHNSSK